MVEAKRRWVMPTILAVLFAVLGIWFISTGTVWPGIAFVCIAAGWAVFAATRLRSR